MSKIKILTLASFGLLTLSAAVTLAWAAYYCNKSIDQIFFPKVLEINQANEPFYDAILADLKTLEASPLFIPTTYQNDAEIVLANYASWIHGETPSLNTPSHFLVRAIIQEYPKWRSTPEQLMQLAQDPRLAKIDTQWMNSLSAFDHWNVFGPSIVKAGLTDLNSASGITKTRLMANGPLPDYAELSTWALIHFIKLYKSGKTLAAYQSYHKVTELIHSSSTLIGNMVAVAMLRGENSLLNSFPITERTGFSAQSIEAYKRVSWAWAPLIIRTHFFDFPEQFKAYLKAPNGLCGGLNEAVRFFPGLQQYMLPHFVFEKNYTKNMLSSRDFQKKLFATCGMQKHENFLNNTSTGYIISSEDSFDPRSLFENNHIKQSPDAKTLNASKIPFVRKALALLFYSIGVPNYLKYYRDMQK
ncbi:hypothetical protein K2P97_12735 [bacterium]|nr:hypothetical protein [bacterium]